MDFLPQAGQVKVESGKSSLLYAEFHQARRFSQNNSLEEHNRIFFREANVFPFDNSKRTSSIGFRPEGGPIGVERKFFRLSEILQGFKEVVRLADFVWGHAFVFLFALPPFRPASRASSLSCEKLRLLGETLAPPEAEMAARRSGLVFFMWAKPQLDLGKATPPS